MTKICINLLFLWCYINIFRDGICWELAMCIICGIEDLDSLEHLEEEIKKLNEEDVKDLAKFIKTMIKYCESEDKDSGQSEEIVKQTIDQLKKTQYILGRFL